MKIINQENGFTLIELLVVFSIVAILSGIGFAAFVSYSRAQQVIQSANNVKLFINEAKFNSLSTVKTVTSKSGAQLTCVGELIGYRVNVVGSDQLLITQVCNEVTPPNRLIKTLTLPKGVSITSASPLANCSQITFGSLSAIATGTPCYINISGEGPDRQISVDARGNVAINDL